MEINKWKNLLKNYIKSQDEEVLLGFSFLMGTSTWVDILGMIASHAYYYLEDVYPKMTGHCPLKTPSFIKSLFADDNVVVAQPENVRFAPPTPELHQDYVL
ncbi:derlin-2.2-like [Dioscorea cayenensis subsp. rotundata]|uniref:Derlin n=1 Tax=Dioscorea cayennensis subsp. rotundata TaxID=55577 RepID=A0AB40AKV4_DIOCR|nr:derlin-2.2-like [Dioscorea cayenensis subsp. rotundata]XP_039114901.1 derlin-2.2-like [Dioscorea cayenensis subsp. rotundata]